MVRFKNYVYRFPRYGQIHAPKMAIYMNLYNLYCCYKFILIISIANLVLFAHF